MTNELIGPQSNFSKGELRRINYLATRHNVSVEEILGALPNSPLEITRGNCRRAAAYLGEISHRTDLITPNKIASALVTAARFSRKGKAP